VDTRAESQNAGFNAASKSPPTGPKSFDSFAPQGASAKTPKASAKTSAETTSKGASAKTPEASAKTAAETTSKGAPWSNAEGPPPPRSTLWPQGFPWLKKAHAEKGELANRLVEFTWAGPHKVRNAMEKRLITGLTQHPEHLGRVQRADPSAEPASIWQCPQPELLVPAMCWAIAVCAVIGQAKDGSFNTLPSAAYPPAMCCAIAACTINALMRIGLNSGEATQPASERAYLPPAGPPTASAPAEGNGAPPAGPLSSLPPSRPMPPPRAQEGEGE
jgi:hypothetical protein